MHTIITVLFTLAAVFLPKGLEMYLTKYEQDIDIEEEYVPDMR